ncbi:MAG: tripartite tricarboxylate transporter TctB family protein [Rhodobacteraceae bacterium]|nr:tripartite tricarboxylate transporter TctB family protein [Paracoccaceae bacterium]
MRIAELVTAIIIALSSIYLMWKSGEGPSWDPTAVRFANIGINVDNSGPGSGFWPFWLAAAMLVAAIAVMVNWHLRATPESRSEEVYLDSYGKRMLLTVCGGLIAFLILIRFIGFYGAIPLFLFYYIYFLGRHSLLAAIAISAAVPVFCFFFFDVAMRIVLPKGYLDPLFIPLYDIFL